MLRYVLFDLRLFDSESERASSQKGLLWLLEALTRWNLIYLKDHPNTPKLYNSGVKYALPEQFDLPSGSALLTIYKALEKARLLSDPKVLTAFEEIRAACGGEHFRDIPALYENGFGDCDNLAAARVAELRFAGIRAKPRITWRRRWDGGMTYHALVLWPDGSEEDPSLILGMGGEAKKKEREEELRKNEERRQTALAAVFTQKLKASLPAPAPVPAPAGAVIDWGDDEW